MNDTPKHILVSRNDAVGDVILAFPVCGLIKEYFPDCKVSFLGRTYTREIAMSSIFVDDFVNQDELTGLSEDESVARLSKLNIDTIVFLRPDKGLAKIAKKAGIKLRIGTTHRVYHWYTCNKLVRLSRKNSPLHEAQLNLKLLKGVNIKRKLTLSEIPAYYGLKRVEPVMDEYRQLISEDKFNLILHPKSHGNSLEWRLQNFTSLIQKLDPAKFRIFISGSRKENEILKPWIEEQGDRVTNICGKLSLTQFISFINSADGLIAASTGPLHIAAASGIHALGLYTDIKTKDAGRWGPIGEKAEYLQCKHADMDTITVDMVYEKVTKWI